MPPSNIISELPEIEWRNLTAPCSSASFSVAFDLSPRAYYGVDGYGHDNTGRQSTPFPCTLWFLNTLEPNLFPDRYQQWVDACVNDKSPDWLLHPLLGLTRARVQSFAVDHNAQLRAGVKVDVVFVETVEDIDQRVSFGSPVVAPEAAAKACDEALAAMNIPYPQPSTAAVVTATGAPPELDDATSLQEAYAAVKGQLFSASLSATTAITKLLGIVTFLVREVEDIGDHDTWAAYANLTTFYASLKRLQSDAERLVARATAKRAVKFDTTLDEFARSVGNNLVDIMSLNVQALRTPFVTKGTELRYYTGTLRLAA